MSADAIRTRAVALCAAVFAQESRVEPMNWMLPTIRRRATFSSSCLLSSSSLAASEPQSCTSSAVLAAWGSGKKWEREGRGKEETRTRRRPQEEAGQGKKKTSVRGLLGI